MKRIALLHPTEETIVADATNTLDVYNLARQFVADLSDEERNAFMGHVRQVEYDDRDMRVRDGKLVPV